MRLPLSDLCFRTITLETGLGGGSRESKPTIREEMTAIQVRWSRLDLGRRWRWSEGVDMRETSKVGPTQLGRIDVGAGGRHSGGDAGFWGALGLDSSIVFPT